MTAMVLLSQWMESQVEFWKPIPGFFPYDVSSHGGVRSYYKNVPLPSGGSYTIIVSEPTLLHAGIDAWGYLAVSLWVKGKRYRRKVHVLVMLAFAPNLEMLPEINHKNAIKSDPRFDNLERCTIKQNREHAVMAGLTSRGTGRWSAKLDDKGVQEIKELRRFGVSLKEIAGYYAMSVASIRDIDSGKTWRHIE